MELNLNLVEILTYLYGKTPIFVNWFLYIFLAFLFLIFVIIVLTTIFIVRGLIAFKFVDKCSYECTVEKQKLDRKMIEEIQKINEENLKRSSIDKANYIKNKYEGEKLIKDIEFNEKIKGKDFYRKIFNYFAKIIFK